VKKSTTEIEEQQILKDIENLVPYEEIARKFGISKSTVSRIKSKHDPEVQKAGLLKKQKKFINQKQQAAVTRAVIKRGDLIIDNLLDSLKVILYNVSKLHQIAEKSENRLDDMCDNLSKLAEAVNNKFDFPIDKNGNQPEKDSLIKKIYSTLGLVSSYYPTNKILIDSVNSMKSQVETYHKLNLDLDAVKSLKEFLDVFFEGMNLLSDENYVLLRDFMISKSEVAEQLFSSFDSEVA